MTTGRPVQPAPAAPLTRRALLAGGAATAAALAGVAVLARRGHPDELPGPVPSAPEGRVTWEEVHSPARGRAVGLYTAAPAGSGSGAGLPVCLVLHGASATTRDFRRFGLARFLTAAVASGSPPFALLGVDGGPGGWVHGSDDDPLRMLVEDVPRWAVERGFRSDRWAVYGWSRGGRGALVLAGSGGLDVRAVAALSPAISRGDDAFACARGLAGRAVGLWCGSDDDFLDDVRAFAEVVPGGPRTASFGPGGHTRRYWNRVTPAAFALVGAALAAGTQPGGQQPGTRGK